MTLFNAHVAEHPTKDMGFSPDCLNGTSVPYAVEWDSAHRRSSTPALAPGEMPGAVDQFTTTMTRTPHAWHAERNQQSSSEKENTHHPIHIIPTWPASFRPSASTDGESCLVILHSLKGRKTHKTIEYRPVADLLTSHLQMASGMCFNFSFVMQRIAARYLPKVTILHHYPNQRLRVRT